jgi:hypothetical protein
MRRSSISSLGLLALAALVAYGAALGPSCASHSGKSSGEEAQPAKAAKPAKAQKAEGVPPPAGSLLSKVSVGMDDTEVRKLIGEPTNVQGYVTGKQFIPYYYGPDTSRVDYKYKAQGRVVFTRNRYSGTLKVVRVDYDPSETGN